MKDDDKLNKDQKERKRKGEGNKFDKIGKENMFKLFLPLLRKHCDLNVKKHVELTPKFQVTIEREVDFLRQVVDEDGDEFILHIEIQTYYEKNLILRLREYNALIARRYNMEVRTFVFYLGLNPNRIETKLSRKMVFSEFSMLAFCELPHEDFIDSTNPREIILAIIADLENKPPHLIIKEIIKKLENTVQSKAKLKKYVAQLQVLSQLRNLGTVYK